MNPVRFFILISIPLPTAIAFKAKYVVVRPDKPGFPRSCSSRIPREPKVLRSWDKITCLFSVIGTKDDY